MHVYRVCGISYRYINRCWTSNVFTVKRLKAVMNLANFIATNQSTCRAGSPDFSSLHTVRDKMSAVAFDP